MEEFMKSMSKFYFVLLALFLLNVTSVFAQNTEKSVQETEKITQNAEKNAQDTEKPDKPKREVDTLFKYKRSDFYISGYGAFTGSYARIKGQDAFLPGFRAGVILDNFVLGFSGAGLAHPNKRTEFGDKSYTDNKDYVNFGYGGGMIEYYFFPKRLVHLSIGTTIGGGGLSFSSHKDNDDDDDNEHHSTADKFFVVEPEANIFVNITRFCRVGIGGSYRYIKGLDNETYKDKHFSGPNVKVIAAFGWF
jgi:hypothetical protein